MKAYSEMTDLNTRNDPPGGCTCGRATEAFSVPWRYKQFSEFANTTFAATKKQTKHNKRKDTVMKMKNNLLSKISAVTQSKWIRPALMTLAIFATLLLVTGCPGPHH